MWDLNKLMTKKISFISKNLPFDLLHLGKFCQSCKFHLLVRICVNFTKTAQKMKFFIILLRIWSNLLKKPLMENITFLCSGNYAYLWTRKTGSTTETSDLQ